MSKIYHDRECEKCGSRSIRHRRKVWCGRSTRSVMRERCTTCGFKIKGY